MNEILRSVGSRQQIKPISKFRLAIYAILAYFIFLPFLWWLLHEKDWWFYTKTVNFSKTPELSKDIVLIDIPYPDKVSFRKQTGQFLQQLAQSTDMPSAVGLDIVYKKFDTENEHSNEATAELIKGISLLKAKGVPVITGYDPDIPKESYDMEILDAATDVGHNFVNVRDGKFHAKVYEAKKSSVIISAILFLSVMMLKNDTLFADISVVISGILSSAICIANYEFFRNHRQVNL